MSNGMAVAKASGTAPDDFMAAMKNARMWAASGNHFTPCETAVPALPGGCYRIAVTDRGIYFVKKDLAIDELLELPDSATEEILEHMTTFWASEARYREFKFLWKRGIFLYGPPGSGKTSTIELLSRKVIGLDGIVVFIDNPHHAIAGLEAFRFVEKTRKLLLVIEDIDAITANSGESALLNLLDGEFQTDNVVVVATTNYPERLDKRITNRPSRFDIVKKIGMPNEASRKVFLSIKNPRLQKEEHAAELETWVKDTKEFSVAHMKELVIAAEVLQLGYKESLARIKKMMSGTISSGGGGTLGFGSSNEDD